MNDRIKPEEASAVEEAPALTPRSDLPQSPASRPGGSSYRDEIDELVDASIKRGPSGWVYQKCPRCNAEWHGFKIGSCGGSHLNVKGANEIRKQGLDRAGGLPSSS